MLFVLPLERESNPNSKRFKAIAGTDPRMKRLRSEYPQPWLHLYKRSRVEPFVLPLLISLSYAQKGGSFGSSNEQGAEATTALTGEPCCTGNPWSEPICCGTCSLGWFLPKSEYCDARTLTW